MDRDLSQRNGVVRCETGTRKNVSVDCDPEQPLAPRIDRCDFTDEALSLQNFAQLNEGPADGNHSSTGPGSELKRMLPWLAAAAKGKPIQRRIATINNWGVKGCRLNAETIAAWLVQEAARQDIDPDDFTLPTARSLVLTAIRRYERKFPDGPLETD